MKYFLLTSALIHLLIFAVSNSPAAVDDLGPPISISVMSSPGGEASRGPVIRAKRTNGKLRQVASVSESDSTTPSTGSTIPKESDVRSGSESVDGLGSNELDYRSRLWLAIERLKEYPAIARSRGHTGVVGVKFTVTKSGQIKDVVLAAGCDYEVLNRAAVETITRLEQFEPVPDSVSMGDWNVQLSLKYTLN